MIIATEFMKNCMALSKLATLRDSTVCVYSIPTLIQQNNVQGEAAIFCNPRAFAYISTELQMSMLFQMNSWFSVLHEDKDFGHTVIHCRVTLS